MWKALLLIIVLFSALAFAQSEEKSTARKIDEFGVLVQCDLNKRLESLRYELNNDSIARGTIIVYQSVNALPDNFKSPPFLSRIKTELRFLGVDESRIELFYGGFRKIQSAEVWIVPFGAEKPAPSETLPTPTLPTDKTFVYGRKSLYPYDFDYPIEYLTASAKKERLAIEKENKKDGIESQNLEEYGYTKKDIEEMKYQWVTERFGEVLKTQPTSTGLLIFYADSKHFDVKAIQQVIEEGKRRISKENNISESQIKILYGGYRDSFGVDYWIIPKDGEEPKPTQDSYIFDEFGKLSEKKWKQRLDKYKEKIFCGSDEVYYVRIFAPDEKTANEIGKKYLEYIVKLRCVDPPKITVVYGGEDFYSEKNEKLRIELWIVPFGGEPPID